MEANTEESISSCADPPNQLYISNTLEPEKEFILLFETLPGLWDFTDPHYTNKYKRKHDLAKLLPVLKKIKPSATIEDVKKKINILRSNYRRELKKIEISKKSGAGSDDLYKPRVWSFPYLHFLKMEQPVTIQQGEDPIPISTIKYNRYSTSDECETPVNPATSKVRKRKRVANHTDILNTPEITSTTDRDDQIFGEYITSVLRSFNSESSKRKLKRVIQRAIVDIQDEEDGMESYSQTFSPSN